MHIGIDIGTSEVKALPLEPPHHLFRRLYRSP
jgi:hypothetical protein